MDRAPVDPFDLLETVTDEPSFLRFLEAMANDFALEAKIERERPSSPYGAGARGWQNDRVDSFLERAHAWASSPGRPDDLSDAAAVWRRCAEIIYAGKIYE